MQGIFGWKQATIWAIEEPEQSMHYSLERETAAFISAACNDGTRRLQCFATTHSEAVQEWSDKWIIANKASGETSLQSTYLEEALDVTSKTGIGRYCNPLLLSRHKPLLLVDGERDARVIKAYYTLKGYSERINVACLSDLNKSAGSGGTELQTYLKMHKHEISLRSAAAPIIILFDWEDTKIHWINNIDSLGRIKSYQWQEVDANPCLGETFRGIERYYSNRLILKAKEHSHELALSYIQNEKRFLLEERSREQMKGILHVIVKTDFRLEDAKYLSSTLDKILVDQGICKTLFP